MASPKKKERNAEIMRKIKAGWPFRKIARHYNLHHSTVIEIYGREKTVGVSVDNSKKRGLRAVGV